MVVGPISVSNRTGQAIIGIALIAVITLVMGAVLVETMPGIIADFKERIAAGELVLVAVIVGLTALLTLVLAGTAIWALWKDGDRIAAHFLSKGKDDAE